MDRDSMEEFFKMVGFTPPEQSGGEGRSEGAARTRQGSSAGQDASEGGRRTSGAGWRVIRDAVRERAEQSGGSSGGASIPDLSLPRWWKRALPIAILLLLAVVAGAYWWFHPAINIHSEECWRFAAVILIPLFVVFRFMAKYRATKGGSQRASKAQAAGRGWRIASFVPAVILAVGVLGAVLSLSLIPGNAERYSSVLEVRNSDFASDIQEVDYNSIPVIDGASSALLGNRTLGEIPEFVSQFEISGLYSQINYHGRPVRVSPLNYADFFKWFNNREGGIPAYVIVDMVTQDAQVVRLDTPIHYSESEPFERNIDRYVQLKFPFYMFEQKSFEIDEDGTPWWVCPVQTRTIGLFGGETISRVVLVNASTGEVQDYAIEDCPQWVDRAYPSELLLRQYNWYGSLRNGWINSWLGQKDVVQTTPGTDGQLGYNYIAKDDDVWVYTGVTSATADNAIVGFILVNQRTSEAHFYAVAGATEESAMNSAQGQVQHLGYQATFPLLLNINGQPTYFMALKDKAGLAKKFAMLDIQRYQNVAIGDTVAEAQKSYKALLATNGVASGGEAAEGQTATGIVRTTAQAVIDGASHLYLTLEGDPRIYDCPLPAVIESVGVRAGDSVRIEFQEGDPTSTVTALARLDAGGAPASGEQRAEGASASAAGGQATASSGSSGAAATGSDAPKAEATAASA